MPLALADLIQFQVGGGSHFPKRGRFAVNKFGAQLDRCRKIIVLKSKYTTTYSISGFENENVATSASKVPGGGQSGGAGPDDYDCLRFHVYSSVGLKRKLPCFNRGA